MDGDIHGEFLPLPGLSVGGRPGKADSGTQPTLSDLQPASPWMMGALQAQTFYTLVNNVDM